MHITMYVCTFPEIQGGYYLTSGKPPSWEKESMTSLYPNVLVLVLYIPLHVVKCVVGVVQDFLFFFLKKGVFRGVSEDLFFFFCVGQSVCVCV